MKIWDTIQRLVGMGEAGIERPLLSSGYAPPVPEEPQGPGARGQGSGEAVNRPLAPETSLYGATGTPIVSGFVSDLQEYNPRLRGRPAFAIYEQMRRSDADVAALLFAMKLPIRSAECKIVPGVQENEPEFALAKEIAEFVEENLFGGLEYENEFGARFTQRWESVIENDLLCLDFGCSGSEDLWHIDGDRVRLRKIAPRLPLTLYRFHVTADGETLNAIEQWGYRGNQFVNVVVPAQKFTLIAQHMEGANFYGISSLRFAYQPWYVKQALYRITSIAAEHNAMGIPVIKAGLNPSKEDMDAAHTWVQNLAVNEQTGMALPNGWEFILQGISGRIYDPMPFIQHMSEQIVRSGLAMFMSLGTTQSGSRALGNTMVDFFQMGLQATAKLICETRTESSIRRLTDFNFPRRAGKNIPYPRLIIPHIAVLNPLDILGVVKDVADAKIDLIQPDDETENHIRKQLGWPLKAKEARVRYAPVVQRVEEQGADPQEEESGSRGEAVPRPSPNPGNKAPAGKNPPPATSARPAQGTGSREQGTVKASESPSSPPLAPGAPHLTPAGRALTRPLQPHELKHDFDAHAERQDKTAAAIARILRAAKPGLIREAAARAASFEPTTLDKLELPFPRAIASRLERALKVAHNFGRQAVYDERKKATGKGTGDRVQGTVKASAESAQSADAVLLADNKSAEQDKPRLIAEASVSDLNNWLTSRVRGSAVDNYKKGLTDQALEKSIIDDLVDGSDSFLERIADEASRSAVAGGRYDAFQELQGEIAKYTRSEALDANTCEPCAAGDGQEWESLDDVDWSPGDDCEGGDNCRGQLLPIFEDEGKVELE